jgi:hypothetical protein
LVAEDMMNEQTQKTNLEESQMLGSQLHKHVKKAHKKSGKHHKKTHHAKDTEAKKETASVAPVVAVQIAQAPVVHAAPAAKNLLATKSVGQDSFDKFSQ